MSATAVRLPISLDQNARKAPEIVQWRGTMQSELQIHAQHGDLPDLIGDFAPDDGWMMLVGKSPGLRRLEDIGLDLPADSMILAAEFANPAGTLEISTVRGGWRAAHNTGLAASDEGKWIFSRMRIAANAQFKAPGVEYWVAMDLSDARGLAPRIQLFRGFLEAGDR